MIFPLRPLIGFGAAFAAMATVLVAGLTAPSAETAEQTAARCPDSMKSMRQTPVAEAEHPA
jgi:hypothetical protein